MTKIAVVSGDLAPGLYNVHELALGIERVVMQPEARRAHLGELGATLLGVRDIAFTAHLLDGGRFQAVTDPASYDKLQREIARAERECARMCEARQKNSPLGNPLRS